MISDGMSRKISAALAHLEEDEFQERDLQEKMMSAVAYQLDKVDKLLHME